MLQSHDNRPYSFSFSSLFAPDGDMGHQRRRHGPGSDPLQRRSAAMSKSASAAGRPKAKIDFLDPDYSSERRAAERREQYKLVKAHVMKDESGRTQAYGWSIPTGESMTAVPVPVHIRPLIHQDANLKVKASCTISGSSVSVVVRHWTDSQRWAYKQRGIHPRLVRQCAVRCERPEGAAHDRHGRDTE